MKKVFHPFSESVRIAGATSPRNNLIRGALGSSGLKAAHALLGIAVAILLARSLGTRGYGVYTYAFSLISLLAVPAQMGLPTLLVRETAKYRYQQKWGLLRGLLHRTNQVVLGFSLLLGLTAGNITWFLASHSGVFQIETFLWGLLLVPLISLGNLRGAALRGLHRVLQGQVPEMLLRPGLLLLFASAAAFIFTLTPTNAMALHALAAALAFGFGAMLLRKAVPIQVSHAELRYDTRVWLRSVLPLSLLAGMSIVNSQADIVMLGLLADIESVGVYRAATQGAMLVVFSLTAINTVIAPQIAQLYASGNTEQLQRIATWSARAILLIAIPVSSVFILFGAPILQVVFGIDYVSGYVPLAILCIGQLINAAAGSVGLLLNMTGHERDTVRGVAVATASNVILNLILIPRLGMNGAAIATAVALLIWNAILCRKVWVRIGIQSTAIPFRFSR